MAQKIVGRIPKEGITQIQGEAKSMAISTETRITEPLERHFEPINQADTTNTGGKTTLRSASDEEAVRRSASLLRTMTSTAVLADIFAERVKSGFETDTALRIYETEIFDRAGSPSTDLKDAILGASKPELKYNLIRVQEELEKLRVAMDREIRPIWNRGLEINKHPNPAEKNKFRKEIRDVYKSLHPLTQMLLERRIIGVNVK